MRSRIGLKAAVTIGLAALVIVGPRAQAPPVQAVSPFDIVGFIQAATVDTPGDVRSGGTITVNGTVVIVPRNTLLQMPAFALTWQEVFANAPAPYGPGSGPGGVAQSGLARSDVPRPMTTYEVHIQGNRVVSGGSDRFIAGLLFLSQQSLNVGAGFINFINHTTGEMRVGGVIGNSASGTRLRINDPLGRFTGSPMTHDPRFTIDESNPTVRSNTGFPMCVSRSPAVVDARGKELCPESNRPRDGAGNPLTIFTMNPPDLLTGGEPTGGGTNPFRMAPFEVGDYVVYNGNLVTDANGPYMSAWGALDNVGIFTAPGTQPTYVAIDVMLLGVGGIPNPNLPQEAAVRTRMEGFTTDPTSFVDLFAVDVDPCTGAESWRYYDTVGVDPGPNAGRGAVAGRWRWRPNIQAPFLPPTRELLAVSENGILADWNTGLITPTPNGLIVGQYQAPNFTFIFPENLFLGTGPVPANFEDFPFLAGGSGPHAGLQLGQLSPWPGGVAPIAPVCTPTGAVFAPVADAGLHQNTTPGRIVTLDATASRDPNANPLPLTFLWTQMTGPLVPMANANTATPTFLAPPLPPGLPVTREFMVTVSNGFLSSSATVTVTEGPLAVGVDNVTVLTALFRFHRSRLDVTAVSDNPAAVLTLVGWGVMTPGAGAGIPAPPGNFFMLIVGVNPIPASVTVTSSLGGSATLPVTVR